MSTYERAGLANSAIGQVVARIIGPRGLAGQRRLRDEVDGKVAVITGASHGLGAATARLLGAAGAIVILGARSRPELEKVAAEIEEAGGRAVPLHLDLATDESIAGFSREILDQYGHVDYLVHNAGKSLRRSIHLSYNRPKDLETTSAANYLGPIKLTLALLPGMRERGSGHIVNVSTVGVKFPVVPKWGYYLSSKAAFDWWMRAVAMESRPDGVTLTTFYGGLLHTRMSAPSKWMSRMPGQTPEQGAFVIARAIVDKPRTQTPLYGHLSAVLVPLLRTPIEMAMTAIYRRLGDTEASLRSIEKGTFQ